MIKIFYVNIFLALLLFGCSTSDKILVGDKQYEIYQPPRTVKIVENFYADIGEVTNIDYKEYTYWLSYIFGKESLEYQNALPDSLVWFDCPENNTLGMIYYDHPSFDTYPVVGISYAQAKSFTDWRTNRVAELILVNKGFVKLFPKQNRDNYFTIQRYSEGDYEWLIKREDVLLPKYSLPTEQEWEYIAQGESSNHFGIDSLSRHNKKVLKKSKYLFNTNEYLQSKASKYTKPQRDSAQIMIFTSSLYSFGKNVNELYHTIGNVAEIIDDEGLCKGGSWLHTLDESKINKNLPFEKTNCWTGFRNICRWELVKVE